MPELDRRDSSVRQYKEVAEFLDDAAERATRNHFLDKYTSTSRSWTSMEIRTRTPD